MVDDSKVIRKVEIPDETSPFHSLSHCGNCVERLVAGFTVVGGQAGDWRTALKSYSRLFSQALAYFQLTYAE